MVSNLDYLPGLGSSDHICLSFKLNCYTTCSNETPQEKLCFHKGNYEKMRRILDNINWEDEIDELPFSQAWDYFTKQLEATVKECILKSKPRSKKRNMYMTCKAMRLKKKK